MLRTLIIGDIFGRPGREMATKTIQKIRQEHEIDYIIANGENLAHGTGMTPKTLQEMQTAGVDFFTTGNHIWDKPDIFPELEKVDPLVIRPENVPPGNPGKGYRVVSIKNKKVLIVNLMGRVFMRQSYDCPFRRIDSILKEHDSEELDAIFIDFHAEATSEKIAFKHYVDGRVTALWGTHTHVPTADEEVTSKGTGYITDLGMVGPIHSVIGAKVEGVVESFLKQDKLRLDVADGPCVFNGVLLESSNMKTVSIQRVQIKESSTV